MDLIYLGPFSKKYLQYVCVEMSVLSSKMCVLLNSGMRIFSFLADFSFFAIILVTPDTHVNPMKNELVVLKRGLEFQHFTFK